MTPRYFVFTLALLTAFPWGMGLAQNPAAAPTVKTNVDEVVLDLIARDKKGKPVTDLKPEEITVTDNGAPTRRSPAFAWSAARRRFLRMDLHRSLIRSVSYDWSPWLSSTSKTPPREKPLARLPST